MKKRIIACVLMFLLALSIALPLVISVTATPVSAAAVYVTDGGSHTHKYVRKVNEWKNPSDWVIKKERLVWKECSCGKRQGAREYWAYYNGSWHYMWNL